jgi:peptidoglycan hydrolase CwlO-like protein
MIDLEIIINSKANEIWYHDNASARTNLSNYLAGLIDSYRFMKNTPWGGQYAENCLRVIQQAYSYGLIKEVTGSVAKISEAEKRISQLENEIQNRQNELESLSSKYLQLQGKYQELVKRLPTFFKDGGQVSK